MSRANGRPAREMFGQVAVRKGFVTPDQVRDALRAQRRLTETGSKHKLIGLVMLELGLLDTTALIVVLKELNKSLHSTASVAAADPRIARRR